MVRFERGEVLTEEEFDRTVKSRWTHPPQFLAERKLKVPLYFASKDLLEDLRSGQLGLGLAPASLAKRNQPVGQEEPKPPAIEEPIYKVMMPPLTFDAAAPPPPPTPSPKTILLVREVHAPTEVFRGRVEKRSRAPAARPVEISATAEDSSSKKHAGLAVYLGRLFRRIFAPHRRCAGAGCA